MLEFLINMRVIQLIMEFSFATTSRRPVADQLRTTLPLTISPSCASLRIKCLFILYGSIKWLSMVVDVASKTSGRPKLLGDFEQPFADQRITTRKNVEKSQVGDTLSRFFSMIASYRSSINHLSTSGNLRQPPQK